MFSLILFIFSLILFVFCLILFIFSILFTFIVILFIFSHNTYLQTPYFCSVSSYLHSVTSYIYSVSSYFIQSSVSHLASHTLWEDIVPHILPCSRFRNKKRCENFILHNFIYFIDGTVKLLTDDVVNKSVVFRITETSHCSGLKMKEMFLI